MVPERLRLGLAVVGWTVTVYVLSNSVMPSDENMCPCLAVLPTVVSPHVPESSFQTVVFLVCPLSLY